MERAQSDAFDPSRTLANFATPLAAPQNNRVEIVASSERILNSPPALPIVPAFGKVRLDHAQLFYVVQIGLVSGDNAAMLSSRS
jgi:hypothetical protein